MLLAFVNDRLYLLNSSHLNNYENIVAHVKSVTLFLSVLQKHFCTVQKCNSLFTALHDNLLKQDKDTTDITLKQGIIYFSDFNGIIGKNKKGNTFILPVRRELSDHIIKDLICPHKFPKYKKHFVDKDIEDLKQYFTALFPLGKYSNVVKDTFIKLLQNGLLNSPSKILGFIFRPRDGGKSTFFGLLNIAFSNYVVVGTNNLFHTKLETNKPQSATITAFQSRIIVETEPSSQWIYKANLNRWLGEATTQLREIYSKMATVPIHPNFSFVQIICLKLMIKLLIVQVKLLQYLS